MATTASAAVLLLSHGSRDPRAGLVVGELVRAVTAGTGRVVRAAYLDFAEPDATVGLRRLAAEGFTSVRVVPLLFTPGYHLTHDVPLVLAASGVTERMDVSVAPSLLGGGTRQRELLLMALVDRLIQAGSDGDVDGLVLASAGSSSQEARLCIESLARDLGRSHGIAVEPAFASSGNRTPAQALEALSERGVHRPAVASLFVAPGRLSDSVAAGCPDVPVADPLGMSPAFVELLVTQTRSRTYSGASRL
ncbi:MAG: CbiX/SirB N-terminal domain-containing protein [Actinomycetota bacterium]